MAFSSEQAKEMWRNRREELVSKIREAVKIPCEHGNFPASDCTECNRKWHQNTYLRRQDYYKDKSRRDYRDNKSVRLAEGKRRYREGKYWLRPYKKNFQRKYFFIYNMYRDGKGRLDIPRSKEFEAEVLQLLNTANCKCEHKSRFHELGLGACHICFSCRRFDSPEIREVRKQFRQQFMLIENR